MPGLSAGVARGKTELAPRFRFDAGEHATTLAISPDGELALVGLGDGRLVGLGSTDGRESISFLAHQGGVLGSSFAPGGQAFVTCGQEAVAKLWGRDGTLRRELPGGSGAWVEHVAWSPSGEHLATACGRRVRIWTGEGEPLVETEPLDSTVTALTWRRDGNALAACCYGGVHVLPIGRPGKVRHLAWKGSLVAMAWSPDAKVIACGSQDCSVHFWRLSTGKDSQMTGYPFKPKALAWDSESKLLATSGDATVTVWDFRGKGPEGTRPFRLDAHKGVCTRLAFSPRRGTLASGSQDTSVLLWEPRRSERPVAFAFLEDEVTGIEWHPQHHTLVGIDASGTVCGWEVS